jgi:hypothetical protein
MMRKRKPRRLTKALLETADDMRRVGYSGLGESRKDHAASSWIIGDIFKQILDSRSVDALITALPDCWQRGNF